MGTLADFQKAIFAALSRGPALSAISTAIYDDVPHESETPAPIYPYVTLGEQMGAEESASEVEFSRFQIAIHAWSRKAGRLQCLEMLDAIRAALSLEAGHFIGSGKIVDIAYLSHETMREADGETYHGIIRFGGLLQLG